jgi:hypothetical protein
MSDGRSSPLLRIAKALGAYALLALLLWWVVEPIRRVVLLPEMFVVGTRVALVLAAPLVAAVAWRYPELGRPSEPGEPED